jgi:hypothetical protein
MHKEKYFINLSLREKLQIVHGPGFTNKMGIVHMKFIKYWAEGGIVPKNSEFMETGCFESNCRFSMANPCVQGTGDKGFKVYMI